MANQRIPPTTEEATINAMMAIIQAVNDPESMLARQKEIIKLNTLSDERRAESNAAEATIAQAKADALALDNDKRAHAVMIAKDFNEISKARSEADSLLSTANLAKQEADRCHQVADKRQSDMNERERLLNIAKNDLDAKESDYQRRNQILIDEEARAAAKKKRLADAMKDD